MDFSKMLYEKLPEIYRREDANMLPLPYPLKRFLKVLGAGFDEVQKYIEDFRNVQNVDTCPKELLPLLAQQFGLDFPYDMDEASQRKFIKVLPVLYSNKGTEDAFKFLAREIFGESTNLNISKAEKPEDMPQEEWEKLGDWQKLLVYLEVNGETLKLDNKHLNFIKFCEIIRPVNTTVIPYLAMFYEDYFDRINNVRDNYNGDFISEVIQDVRLQNILDEEVAFKVSELVLDAYEKQIKEEFSDTLKEDFKMDKRWKPMYDTFSDMVSSSFADTFTLNAKDDYNSDKTIITTEDIYMKKYKHILNNPEDTLNGKLILNTGGIGEDSIDNIYIKPTYDYWTRTIEIVEKSVISLIDSELRTKEFDDRYAKDNIIVTRAPSLLNGSDRLNTSFYTT